MMEHDFRERGNDLDQPYLVKGAFTAEAETNIKGNITQFIPPKVLESLISII